MVLGILTAVAACPAIIGTTEAVRQGQRQNAREEHRGRKCNLTITLLTSSYYSSRFNGAKIVLKDNKLWVDVSSSSGASELIQSLHPFTGYFLPYPDMASVWRQAGYHKAEGMVTTISNDPPFLNWVYVDRSTHEVKYGIRDEAQPHRVGPWDVTKIDRRLTFEGWEGFIVVEEEEGSGLWALYFDCNDDGLRSGGRVGTKGRRMLAVEVWRKELRIDMTTAVDERVERLKERQASEQGSSGPD